jgi:hypothetical protein
VIGSDTVAHKPEGNGKLFEEVDTGISANPELLTPLGKLTKENIGYIDSCGASADNCDAERAEFI